jgi:chemotaxis protein CheD
MSSDDRIRHGSFLMVGIAEFSVVKDQEVVLRTAPLGACLGIAVHDPVAKVSGLLHSLLPDSSIDPAKAAAKPGMFLDTGLRALLEAAQKQGAAEERLLVYVAGGGRIMDESSYFNLGKRNREVLAELLAQRGLNVVGESVGGLVNRTLELEAGTGRAIVRISGHPGINVLCKP